MPVSPGWAYTHNYSQAPNSLPNPWDPLPFSPILSKPYAPQQDPLQVAVNLVELDVATTLPTSLRRTSDSDPTTPFLQPSPAEIKSRTKLPVWTPPCLPRPRSPTPKQTIRYVKRSCVDQEVNTKPQTIDSSTETGSSIQLHSAFFPVKPTKGCSGSGVSHCGWGVSSGICGPMSTCNPVGIASRPAMTSGLTMNSRGPPVACRPTVNNCGSAVSTCGPAVNSCEPAVNTCGRCIAHQCSQPFGNWNEYQKGAWVQSGGVDSYRWGSNAWRSCGQPCEWVKHSQTLIDPLPSKSSHHCGHIHTVSESEKTSRADSPTTISMHHKHHKCRRP